MAEKRCPICGERYSETYRSCPFCEEEEALQRGGAIRRTAGRGGKRAVRSRQPNLLSPVLVGLIILMAALLVYLLYGDRILERFQKPEVDVPPVEDVLPDVPVVPPDVPDDSDPGAMPEDPDVDTPTVPTVDISALPATLKVNNPDFTLRVGESYAVKVTAGGSGPYTWVSSDDGVVSVGSDGKVTAISVGKAEMTVHNGKEKGTFIVFVKAAPGGATAPTTPTAPSGGSHKLSSTDFTLPVGMPDVKLTVSGVTTGITWASKDPAVATVSSSGAVKSVGKGTTTVTASWDGQTLECIVRVPY